MKLQRVVNRKRGENTYYKWQVTLPPEIIAHLGWTDGDDLEAKAEGDHLKVRRVKPERSRKG